MYSIQLISALNCKIFTFVIVYLSIKTKNIICVDWSKLANSTLPPPIGLVQYLEVVQNIDIVGMKVASLVEFLIENKIISSPKMVHLIGHSLGAHVSGAAGRALFNRTGMKVHRISGLDPAGMAIVENVE